MIVFVAAHVLPVSAPPLRDGAIAVERGRIVAVGSRRDLVGAAGPGDEVRDLGRVALIPGLVNAHTHLELSWTAGRLPAGLDYVGWVRALVRLRAEAGLVDARAAAESSLRRMLDRGTVAVGDVGNEGWTVPLVARSGLHGTAFIEVYGFRASDAERIEIQARERIERLDDDDTVAARRRLTLALTPHAPHTTSAALLTALARRAEAAGGLLSIHVAESEAECALLADGGGAFPAFFRERDMEDETFVPPGLSPVAYLSRLGLLGPRTLAVHAVHVDVHDRSLLRASGTTVVTCPRSNRTLSVGPAPVPQLLREGVPVALGTDSLASAPDLDLFGEMAALRREHPALRPSEVLRIGTLNGARALRVDDRLGTLAPGKLAEAVVVELPAGDDPLEAVSSAPERVHRLDAAPAEATRR